MCNGFFRMRHSEESGRSVTINYGTRTRRSQRRWQMKEPEFKSQESGFRALGLEDSPFSPFNFQLLNPQLHHQYRYPISTPVWVLSIENPAAFEALWLPWYSNEIVPRRRKVVPRRTP